MYVQNPTTQCNETKLSDLAHLLRTEVHKRQLIYTNDSWIFRICCRSIGIALISFSVLVTPKDLRQVVKSSTIANTEASLSPAMINFGYQLIGTSGSKAVSVTNSATTPLLITDIWITGRDRGDFAPSNVPLPITIAPANNIIIYFEFTPAAPWKKGGREATAKFEVQGKDIGLPLSGVGTTCLGPISACQTLGSCADTDGDGLNDDWETAGGVDIDNDGEVSGSELFLTNADPVKPDVYLHYDYTAAIDHDHKPPEPAIKYIVDAFAAHGVNLHIDPQHNAICENAGDTGCVTVGTGAQVVTLGKPGSGTVDSLCAGPSATSPHELRAAIPYLEMIKPAYHYMVFAHYASIPTTGGPWTCPTDAESPACGSVVSQPPIPGNLGTSEIGGDDSIVATQPLVDSGAVSNIASIPLEWWAALSMHELGHNLGLLHGGGDCFNNKPNYISVMNYRVYVSGISVGALPGDIVPKSCNSDADCYLDDHSVRAHCSTFTKTCYRIDYSDRLFNDLDESGGLDEVIGLQGGVNNADISWRRTGGVPLFSRVAVNGSAVDWNNDSIIEKGAITDINADGQMTLLRAQNDWATQMMNGVNNFVNLKFRFQCDPNYGN